MVKRRQEDSLPTVTKSNLEMNWSLINQQLGLTVIKKVLPLHRSIWKGLHSKTGQRHQSQFSGLITSDLSHRIITVALKLDPNHPHPARCYVPMFALVMWYGALAFVFFEKWEKRSPPTSDILKIWACSKRAQLWLLACLLAFPRNHKTFRDSWGKFIIKYSATSVSYYLLTE